MGILAISIVTVIFGLALWPVAKELWQLLPRRKPRG